MINPVIAASSAGPMNGRHTSLRDKGIEAEIDRMVLRGADRQHPMDEAHL
ncbi:MAG: hypothetical protein KF724_07660 [Phycisphaeraceae bacterium]|nr:hypothetical protein [Phycisphaeraceae bacterium]